MNNKTVCLNMIVKNESHVIQRCLASVKELIDYWVIVDTGSSDGTQRIIEESLKGIPGELHERPWVNFGFNRNEALELARNKADYLLFIDADDKLTFSKDFVMPCLDKDCYCVYQREIRKDNTETGNYVALMINNHIPFKWDGVLHETLKSSETMSCEVLSEVIKEYLNDGYRSQDPERCKKDIQILERALQDDPLNTRNVFFLAQAHINAGDLRSAIKYYEKRASMGGQSDEVFYALYSIGVLQKSLKFPSEIFIKSFYKAYRYRPSRAEPLFALASYHIEVENYFFGYLIAKFALSIPLPEDLCELFVDTWIYEWGILSQFYICSIYMGKYDQAYEAVEKILLCPRLPERQRSEFEQELTRLEPLMQKCKVQAAKLNLTT